MSQDGQKFPRDERCPITETECLRMNRKYLRANRNVLVARKCLGVNRKYPRTERHLQLVLIHSTSPAYHASLFYTFSEITRLHITS